ncbi:MAG: type II toxin-antitoxin system Phd/YefM family antitoxin [Anaerolineae bacterium]
MDRQIGITEARKLLAEIVDKAEYSGENCIIIRHGQPAAAVVPMEVYRQWKKERKDLFAAIRRIQATNADVDLEDVMQRVLEAQQAVRQDAVD